MWFDAKEDCIVSFHPQKDNIFKTDPPKMHGASTHKDFDGFLSNVLLDFVCPLVRDAERGDNQCGS